MLVLEIFAGYLAFCAGWFALIHLITYGSAGALGASLVPAIPLILVYVELRNVWQRLIR